MNKIDYKGFWEKGMDYSAYRELIDTLIEEGKSTGPEQSESLLNYSKLNQQRMRRLEKTVKEQQFVDLEGRNARITQVLIITEGWCGDASQIIPVIEKFALHAGVSANYLLRDSNLDLMDAHLINGGRSIPVILFLTDEFEVITQWGPRPQPLQQMVLDYKKLPEPKPPYSEFSKDVQLWYAKDRQQTMLKEWMSILEA
jgi:hypothetical protein